MTWIDISVPLVREIPRWPGSLGFERRQALSIEGGDDVNASEISMDVHVGTHVDAPLHFLQGGRTVPDLSLETMIGPCLVVDTRGVSVVTADVLAAAGVSRDADRVLIKSDNSALWASTPGFVEDYVALDETAARFLIDCGIRLVGIDYLSIQRFSDGPEVHQLLLGAEIVILEGTDLSDVSPGRYELACLPLLLKGAEGAPARAAIRALE